MLKPFPSFRLHTQGSMTSRGHNPENVRDTLLNRADALGRQTIHKSIKSYVSRLRAWLAFACSGIMHGGVLSATPSDMLMFIAIFRNGDSAQKYVSAVKWIYVYLQKPLTWESEKVRQTMRGARKVTRLQNAAKPRRAIRWDLLRRLVEYAWSRGDYYYAYAYVMAANFLLRCKDELIGMCFEQLTFDTSVNPNTVSLRLQSRKNLPKGSSLKRRCICQSHYWLCPVHMASRVCVKLQRELRGKIFSFSYWSLQNVLRAHLSALKVPDANEYSTKAFRRGTAREMLASQSSLAEVLVAGQWRSAAFLLYIDKMDVEEDAVFAALDSLSDEEDTSPAENAPIAAMAQQMPIAPAQPSPPAAPGPVVEPRVPPARAAPSVTSAGAPKPKKRKRGILFTSAKRNTRSQTSSRDGTAANVSEQAVNPAEHGDTVESEESDQDYRELPFINN